MAIMLNNDTHKNCFIEKILCMVAQKCHHIVFEITKITIIAGTLLSETKESLLCL